MTPSQSINYQTIGKSILLLLIALLIGSMPAFSQVSSTTQPAQATAQAPITDEIFTVVEVQPQFTGGMSQLQEYLRKNLHYPEEALKAKVEARVFVSFIILKDGSIRDVHILKGGGYGMDEEAVRLVQNMPNWIPGKQSGRDVNVKYNIVIPFKLADAK